MREGGRPKAFAKGLSFRSCNTSFSMEGDWNYEYTAACCDYIRWEWPLGEV